MSKSLEPDEPPRVVVRDVTPAELRSYLERSVPDLCPPDETICLIPTTSDATCEELDICIIPQNRARLTRDDYELIAALDLVSLAGHGTDMQFRWGEHRRAVAHAYATKMVTMLQQRWGEKVQVLGSSVSESEVPESDPTPNDPYAIPQRPPDYFTFFRKLEDATYDNDEMIQKAAWEKIKGGISPRAFGKWLDDYYNGNSAYKKRYARAKRRSGKLPPDNEGFAIGTVKPWIEKIEARAKYYKRLSHVTVMSDLIAEA